MIEHKQATEPWSTECLGIYDASGTPIAKLIHAVHAFTKAECEANARRIVACVNACEGIPTGMLEAGDADILAYSINLKKQRDKLLSAIKEANTLLAWHEEQIEGRYDNLIAEIEAAK